MNVNNDFHKTKRGLSFAKTSNAQYTTLCDSNTNEFRSYEVRLLEFIESLSVSSAERSILELMLDEGLRISDVLNIKPKHVDSFGYITIIQGKGSSIKVVRNSKNLSFWLGQVRNGFVISDSYNRFYFYRLLKKKGIQMSVSGCSNHKVTHSLRYARAIAVMNASKDLEIVKQDLGHRSINSTKYYVRQTKTL